uniref:zinc finger MYM-type protein 1-like n=1 Tax=Styela clava TaxID=7725 RepID=UPI001939F576|nr:zinc finger MYM-type protein 1-like [Styela clava]
MKRIQPSGAQYRRKKRRREAEVNVLRGSLDAWVKKLYVAKNQLGDENHESVTVVQDDVSFPVNTHLDIVRDNQSHNSIPGDADDFDEVSANAEANAVILNDDAEGNNYDGNFIELFCDHDLGRLRKPISTHLEKFLVQQGPENFQHKEGPFAKREGRSLSKHWFETLSSNGECFQRKWLIYSPCKQAAFCFVCFLFSKCESSFCNEKGFRSWRKLNPRIYKHEKSPGHRNAKREYLDFEARLEKLRVIDYELQRHISSEKKKWRLIVERIGDVVYLLSRQNIAFRSHRNEGVSKLVNENAYENNSGNFLEIIELLADYDVVLFEHLQNARKKPNKVNYLSNKSQNEIINLIAGIIKKKISSKVKKAKYYTLMLDSTPDISRENQIAEILRYVHISGNKDVEIKEVFLGFFQVSEKNAASLVETGIEKLNDDGIDINDCRGQAYDNAAVMSGVRTGVQKRILEINPEAQFVNCENHSLNLACVHAAEVHPTVKVLKSKVEKTVKKHCETRWSSYYNAVEVIHENFHEIIYCLEYFEDDKFSSETKSDACLLRHSLQQFTFVSLLKFWCPVLSSVQKVTKRLQDPKIDLIQASDDLDGLNRIIDLKSEDIIKNADRSASEYCEEWNVPLTRVRQRKMMPGESVKDCGLSAIEEMQRIMNEIANRLKTELSERSGRVSRLADKFSFLLKLDSIDVENIEHLKTLKRQCERTILRLT